MAHRKKVIDPGTYFLGRALEFAALEKAIYNDADHFAFV